MRFLQTILVIFVAQSCLFGGFAAETAIIVSDGFHLIQDLRVGDKVFGVNRENKLFVTGISHTLVQKNRRYIRITIDDQIITVGRNQKFLNTKTNKWVKAKNLEIGDTVRTVQFPGIAKVKNIKDGGANRITLYDIRLEDDHVFCVTNLTIAVHNCPLFTIGLVWTFNTLADITFSGVVFGIVAPFVCATYALFFKKGLHKKGELELQVGSTRITKTTYFDDQLKDCISSSANENSSRQVECLSSPDINYTLPGPCDGKGFDDSTLLPAICVVTIEAINKEYRTCGYSISSNNAQPIDLEEFKDFLISSAYQIESSKQPESSSKNTKRHTIKESEHEAGKKCASTICNPPPKGPYGYFIPSEKHQLKPCGDASAGPTWEDGQKALDQSSPVFDKDGNVLKHRVMVWDKRYLIFKKTSNDIWHGYFCDWNELDNYQRKALQNAKLVNKNGKIIKNGNKA